VNETPCEHGPNFKFKFVVVVDDARAALGDA